MTLLRPARPTKPAAHRFSTVITLDDDSRTTVHVARYERSRIRPKIVFFEQETRLLEWCRQHKISEAAGGGFFLRETKEVLGDLWIAARQLPSAPVVAPWHTARGSLHVDAGGRCELGARRQFAADPHSLLQAGPLLIQGGMPQITGGDNEGFSAASHQFDSDITRGRYPRAAIGMNDTHLWSVACDGRAPGDAGLTLTELADVMLKLGAAAALNLDGGSSASLISGGALRNRSRGDGISFPHGRPIHTAIIFRQQ